MKDNIIYYKKIFCPKCNKNQYAHSRIEILTDQIRGIKLNYPWQKIYCVYCEEPLNDKDLDWFIINDIHKYADKIYEKDEE